MHHRAASIARLLLAGALAFGMTAPALAAEEGSGSESGQETQVSQEKLEQFVAAYAEIQAIRAEYMPKLQQAEDEEEQAKLQEQGQKEMVDAVRAEGLDVSEYQQIGQKINSDRELQSRVQDLMQEQQEAQQ